MLSDFLRGKLDELTIKKKKIEEELSTNFSDSSLIKKLSAELGEIKNIVEIYENYQNCEKELGDVEDLLSDPEMKDLAQLEKNELQKKISELEIELKTLMVPKDPNNKKDCIIEIRPGTGGDESALFTEELLRGYMKFAENLGFDIKIISKNENSTGGIKEVILEMIGFNAYEKFKFEGGVHRVQRIPVTESQGRVHTSAVSVVVLPKIEEKEFEIKDADLRIDVYRSSGPGGQSVNTTDSAVRITHVPTGTVVSCQDEKSQLKNKTKALGVLRSRLAMIEEEKKAKELGTKRLSQIGSGDRSDKIRTYNFPQDRVTDHRIKSGKKNFSNLPGVISGNFDEIVATLIQEEASMNMVE